MTEIDYSKAGKAIANLQGKQSEKYTKLAQKLDKITQLSAEVKELQKEVKTETKELIEDLFDAQDEIYTRVVETISVSFTLSKKPKETVSVQYAKVLDALTEFLTPELITKMEELKSKFSSTVQKQASLTYKIKNEYVDEGAQLIEELRMFRAMVYTWARRFDPILMQVQMSINENYNQNPLRSIIEGINQSLKNVYDDLNEGFDSEESIQEELLLYIINTGEIYKQYTLPIIMKIKEEKESGTYTEEFDLTRWKALADIGAKEYCEEFEGTGQWDQVFSYKIRKNVAIKLKDYYQEQIDDDSI